MNDKKVSTLKVLLVTSIFLATPILQVKAMDYREAREELFGTNKLAQSFVQNKNKLSTQMKDRNETWKELTTQNDFEYIKVSLDYHKQEIIKYVPYYFKKILKISSQVDLKYKETYFEEIVTLLTNLHKAWSINKKDDLEILKKELSKINLEKVKVFPLASMFLRYLSNKICDKNIIEIFGEGVNKRTFSIKEKDKDLKKPRQEDNWCKNCITLSVNVREDMKMLQTLSEAPTLSPKKLKKVIQLQNYKFYFE